MKAINKQQNIDFKDMIFFDDEYGNIQTTERIGVTAIHCPNRLEYHILFGRSSRTSHFMVMFLHRFLVYFV